MTLGAEPRASFRTAKRLAAFLADPVKAGTVRALNITLIGPYISGMYAVRVLIDNLAALTNVTHCSLCCIRSRNIFGWDTPGRLIRNIVEYLPSLLSIEVVGCNANLETELEGMEVYRAESDPPLPAPRLIHVATRFCDPLLGEIWRQCPNVRVVEMEGGDPEEFWRSQVVAIVIEPTTKNSSADEVQISRSLQKFWGYTGTETGIYSIVSHDIVDAVEKINVKVHPTVHSSDDLSSDIYCVAEFFRMNAGNCCSDLKEFVLHMGFDVERYREILNGFRSPSIQRLALVLTFGDHWVASEFDDFLLDMKTEQQGNADVPFFAKCSSLSEFFLPCGSLSDDSTALLAELLSHAPALQHLYFDTADESDDLRAIALKYAEIVSTLESVSWKNQATFKVDRRDGANVTRKTYSPPVWLEWRGIGKWWEI
ncbi:hypothetical protein C8R47DRAFT_1111960 [Mycena vitilis]|nr:hypothetical protein C8R47DRAFT_1111960 [Mycena vitilis]